MSSRLQHKGFLLEETSCAEPTFNQSSAVLLSYYQWVRRYGKQGGDGRGKVWHLFLTRHMCVCFKIVWRANWGLFLLMRARRRHTPDSPECEQMPESGGGWIVGCDSHSVCFYCLRLHKGSLRTWSLHNGAYNVGCEFHCRLSASGLERSSWSVTVAYLYSAPQPLTKLMRMVHILVSWYTASKPWLTDCASRAANSWLLKIFRLHPGTKQPNVRAQSPQFYCTELKRELHWL